MKGGTALNLFIFDMPRLSLDIDLNYIGAADRDTMLAERPKVEKAVQAVCAREDMSLTRLPTDHAGGKWRLRYESALGGGGTLEVDVNFMFRVPLWPVRPLDSRQIGHSAATGILVVDTHELAAGKIAALLARHASRDLFDAHLLLTTQELDAERLRLAFVVYGGPPHSWQPRHDSLAAGPIPSRCGRAPYSAANRRAELFEQIVNFIQFLLDLFVHGTGPLDLFI